MLTSANIQEYKDLDSKNQVDWSFISEYQALSEDFIKEFKDKVHWNYISMCQKLSESFIREFQDKVNWVSISGYQKLSEDFIREFQDKVDWNYISMCQKLSESFIKEFKDKINWYYISYDQTLSSLFIEEFKDKIYFDIQLKNNHDTRTIEQKRQEMTDYAKQWNLRFENDVLHAFREHDPFGRGSFNKTIFYQTGEYHRDWHCDLNPANEFSFGLGIWPKGNIPVEVKLEDWGTAVRNDRMGKARVWAFTNGGVFQ